MSKKKPDTIDSMPINILWDKVLMVPVFGVLDSVRGQLLMESMLEKVLATEASFIILDIAGVATIDSAVANHLIKITQATTLMSCECIISGISPAVAQTVVHLGIELGDVISVTTLKDALSLTFQKLGYVVEKSNG